MCSFYFIEMHIINKVIAVAKGLANRDPAPARSILPGTNPRELRLRAQGFLSFLIPFESKSDMESLFEVVLILGAHLDLRKGPGTSPRDKGTLDSPLTRNRV